MASDQKALDGLLGSWELTMQHSERSEPVLGRQRYEHVLDEAFVMMHWTYDHPDFPDAIAVLDERSCHYFDVRGITRIFEFSIDEAGWTMTRFDPDFSQRFVGRFRGTDAIDVVGNRSADGGATWQHDFTMSLRRLD